MKRAAAALIAALMWPAAPRATMVAPVELGELSREAGTIARGRVVSVEARWAIGRRAIETLVTIDAETYLKGGAGPALTFRVPGGRLGRFRSVTVGAPEFARGERIVVFLGARGPQIPYILGLNQGVYRIVESRAGSSVTPPPVLPAPAGSAVSTRVVRGDPSRKTTPLADFERRVRTLATAP